MRLLVLVCASVHYGVATGDEWRICLKPVRRLSVRFVRVRGENVCREGGMHVADTSTDASEMVEVLSQQCHCSCVCTIRL
jgi:hypothetical protein